MPAEGRLPMPASPKVPVVATARTGVVRPRTLRQHLGKPLGLSEKPSKLTAQDV